MIRIDSSSWNHDTLREDCDYWPQPLPEVQENYRATLAALARIRLTIESLGDSDDAATNHD